MTPTTIERLLTPQEVCDLLQIKDRRTLRRLVDGGDLTPVRIGRSWRFRPDDIRSFIEIGGKFS